MKQMAAPTIPTRKSRMDPLVSLGLAAVLVFFLMSGGVAYFDIQTLREDNQRIVHSLQVITTLGGLLSTVQDAETGQRGFLLTDDEHYLEPYNAALLAVMPQLDQLSELTRDNPRQQNRIGPLKLHIDAKFAELKQTIDLRRTQGSEAALAVVTTDRGKV
jgi:CHASE3 domain sensor protein